MTPAAILLCAGEGTRMNDDRTHKVCYEIAGIPAIIRQINSFKQAGITRFVVVVGSKADKVMSCLDGVEEIVYAYQPIQNGTGSAALYGLKALKSSGYTGPVVIAMGDKIIASDVVSKLISKYEAGGKKAAFVAQPKAFNPGGGRVVAEDDVFYGIVEQTDSFYLAIGEARNKTPEAYDAILTELGLNEKKKKKLIDRAINSDISSTMKLLDKLFTSKDIERMSYVNTATYMIDSDAAIEKLSKAKQNNAQNEVYLTDAINMLAEDGQVNICVVTEPNKIHTYSTMDELLLLQQFFVEPSRINCLPLATEWLDSISSWNNDVRETFVTTYGDDKEFLIDRKNAYINALNTFIAKYGNREVVIARAPGRVNLMGRHIEHRGGSINVMSINRETIVVASPRVDDIIHISNTDTKFKDYSFSILDTIKLCDTANWINFIENDAILKLVVGTKGEWVNYVKAAILRLQLQFKDKLLCGMDMIFSGNIPMAAGLSSSSSIVVATAEAAIALNDMSIQPKEFIHLCGEGEWFVGSRGGSGDHAAMKCGRFGMITHLNFCPFEIDDSVDFPSEYSLVVANSYVEAKKSVGAKDLFNQKVACYEFGFMLVKKLFPQYAPKLQYFKDINTENLGVKQSEVYKILIEIPEMMTSGEVHKALPEYEERINQIQRSHAIPEYYEIRSTMLYGLAECDRAKKCIGMLKEGKYDELGRLMKISHDGDRVWKDGKDYDYSASDEYLESLISDLRSEDLYRVEKAQLYNQPGGYACSTKTIDELVDFINQQEGVIGSELSGAGLGGCILILVKSENVDNLLTSLKNSYYDANNLPMGAEVFRPVSGSGVLKRQKEAVLI